MRDEIEEAECSSLKSERHDTRSGEEDGDCVRVFRWVEG